MVSGEGRELVSAKRQCLKAASLHTIHSHLEPWGFQVKSKFEPSLPDHYEVFHLSREKNKTFLTF
jgi:hypothetical protein